MNTQMRQTKLNTIVGAFRSAADASVTMRIRLLAFLVALVVTMVLGVVIVLIVGPLAVNKNETEAFVRKELSYITQKLTEQCGNTSVQLVLLSQSLSRSIEYQLSDRQLDIGKLQAHPDILEEIIGNELARLQLALEKTKCSGVFLVLDTTANPSLPNAKNSRAGLYIRNSEPNVVGADTIRLYLRGFTSIALKNGLSLQSKWDMEFNVENMPYYHLPLQKHSETALPLSRLYCWSFEGAIPDLGENVLLCSIPIIDSDGNALGVCGFELSEMNFQLNYQPDDSAFKHIISMLSPMDEGKLYTENALICGNYTDFSAKQGREPLVCSKSNGLNTFASQNGKSLVGLYEELKLYPSDSAFAGRRIAHSLLIPKEELDADMAGNNIRLIFICAALLIFGIGASVFISKKYLSPIMEAFNTIHSDEPDETFKTNISEINQLLEQIKAMRAKESPLPDDLFKDFITRAKNLTPTEMEIFRHYLEGKSGNEVQQLMYISVNTLKTHNKHIYAKLGVSSKDELRLYIELIKKSGMAEEIL